MRIQIKRDGVKTIRLEAWEARALKTAGAILRGLIDQVGDKPTIELLRDGDDACNTAASNFYDKPSNPADATETAAAKHTK